MTPDDAVARALAAVDRIVAAQRQQLETDLLAADVDLDDVAALLTRADAELARWRAALATVLPELAAEAAADLDLIHRQQRAVH